jgi:hypothetical protein
MVSTQWPFGHTFDVVLTATSLYNQSSFSTSSLRQRRCRKNVPLGYMAILQSATDALAASGELYSAYIADKFQDNYNDSWRGDSTPIRRNEFIQRLTLESLVIDDDGDVMIYFGADGMFTDHGMEVSLDDAFQPRSTTLA